MVHVIRTHISYHAHHTSSTERDEILGISTVLEFDQTAKENPQAVLDVIHAAHSMGIRALSIGSSYSDFIRVSGWLIRQSELDRAKDEKALRHSSSYLGAGFFDTKPTRVQN